MGVCELWGWGFWLQEGNDILVTENLLSINLLRRITMIDLCKKNLLFTNNWIRSCVTIVIKYKLCLGQGRGRAKGEKHTLVNENFL